MSYLVLARKYRPATFSEVVGQEHVTRTLGNAFAVGRVHHAFLFCGPRGCGKTTLARIVGKALNCEGERRAEAATAEPCGTCAACTSIGNGSAVDYQEMDGASNRGIDAIRELTEAVRYQPAVLRKKVYVIDEVHMLTTEAFNALLKTLEEPPPHVTFVLATTEPHKLPNTILSRCQRYDFKLVPASRLAAHLTAIFAKEQLAIEPNAVSLLVRESGGSVRDALSLCDQIISYVGEAAITERHVAEVLGVADRSLTRTLVRALAGGDAGTALSAVESAIERGVDEVQLARAIVRYLRDLSVLQVAPDRLELVDASQEERAELLEESRAIERSRTTQMFDRMLRCCDELGKTLQPRLVLDCALIDVATVDPLVPLGDLIERLGELEHRLSTPASRAARPAAGGVAGGAGPKAAFKATTPGTGMQRPASFSAALEEATRAPTAPAAAPSAAAPSAAAPAPSTPAAPPAASAKKSSAPRVTHPNAPNAPGGESEPRPPSSPGMKRPPAKSSAPDVQPAPPDVRPPPAHFDAVPLPVEHAPSSFPHRSSADGSSGPGSSADGSSGPGPHRSSADGSSGPVAMQPSGPVPKAPIVANGSDRHEPAQGLAVPSSQVEAIAAWNTVLNVLEAKKRVSLFGIFEHARVMSWTADLLDLGYPIAVHSMGEMAQERVILDELRAIVRELGTEQRNVKVNVRLLDSTESEQAGARSVLETTRENRSVERSKREAEAREHPITKHVLQTFGAQIKEIKTDV
ncbi:MAG: DNA polymerase III subunit gamma/tau [Deltaproteobacteria bacterium]|nr:DNA polymerase III subunit gamma/tau [Deltaproteobacteria bacterium]